jgi:hypothetical protein
LISFYGQPVTGSSGVGADVFQGPIHSLIDPLRFGMGGGGIIQIKGHIKSIRGTLSKYLLNYLENS